MLAFMNIAMALSMWISNTAVCAMLIPIVSSLLIDIFEVRKKILRFFSIVK